MQNSNVSELENYCMREWKIMYFMKVLEEIKSKKKEGKKRGVALCQMQCHFSLNLCALISL